MGQTLPDLTRPTRWRLYVRRPWGATVPHEFTGTFPEDALETARVQGVQLEKVVAPEFQLLDSGEWRQVPTQFLQDAIALVTNTRSGA
ncbi:hypothetical protein [Stenomitos frigidus]|uniref:Uncharacterized protein n=1 Tax=Stenomitos frigidus ULC18 TaxID=2107698 RepID=A0A2T1DY53_9CYAN|nr:hypothetical protein [Stenomitos frigidus]PSB25371.1 hypothetical protein C7B82_23875 [Stenomitos frigidus ULC18]